MNCTKCCGRSYVATQDSAHPIYERFVTSECLPNSECLGFSCYRPPYLLIKSEKKFDKRSLHKLRQNGPHPHLPCHGDGQGLDDLMDHLRKRTNSAILIHNTYCLCFSVRSMAICVLVYSINFPIESYFPVF